MKKIVLLLLFTVSFSFVNAGVNEATVLNSKPVCVAPEEQSVNVYMIKGGGVVSVTRKKGIYDSETQTLTVDGRNYKVMYNSEYGESGKRGAYQFVAGGIYYFNL